MLKNWMMNVKAFENDLRSRFYKESTIKEHIKNVKGFIAWRKPKNETDITAVSTIIIVEFISHLQKKNISVSTINIRLQSIRKYYDYLIGEEYLLSNPTDKIQVKGALKRVVIDPLDYNELEQLYQTYSEYLKEKPTREKRHKAINKRNQLIVSLLIFQGLHSGELQKLEVNHLDLEVGKIYIPSSYNSQPRELKLHGSQIIQFYKFIETLPREQNYLLKGSLKDRLDAIIKELRGLNENVQSARHIRASVIMHWIKLHGKRQAQYMIGHKWISSTEYYERQDLDALTNSLEKHHPLK